MTAALEELGPAADKLQPLLITVNSERDTPPVLKDYLSPFDPRILGLTGTPEQVQAAIRSFRATPASARLKAPITPWIIPPSSISWTPRANMRPILRRRPSVAEMVDEIGKRLGDGDAI